MPLYEYECTKCHRKTEKIESVSGPHLKKCPHCGGKVEQAITAPAIQFKGSGWYVTDYAGKSSAKDSAGESGSSEKSEKKETTSKEGTAKESTAKETKDSGEKKSAKKK
ncbi:MAG: zinc ribbon domain-containing protein [Acidobacteria bacterium]|nr:zinc ribbon domain-containing protein [Acidobacteriota bacterium]MBS1866610.1 zinc ribbon domain-containing protein [Acidobacteriota bacterium]